MQDMIVVDTKDALLVTDRAHAQQVKQVVDTLKADGRDEVVTHPYHTKPWGGVEALPKTRRNKSNKAPAPFRAPEHGKKPRRRKQMNQVYLRRK